MCGIAGFTQFHQTFGDKETLQAMGQAMQHRGPDASGNYLADRIGLCHRRLSIIDLSASGNQPMISHDERYIISFNGEIYNFPALREELVEGGYAFKTRTDTEVILALYARDGKDCLKYLNGMFAFALWDKEDESLFIARDRIGKKPLYYYQNNNDVVFASELKSILQIEQIPRKIRIDSVYDFFAYQYIPDPKSIFEDISKLEPGHYLEVNALGIKKQKYWDISFQKQNDSSEDSLIDLLQNEIVTATRNRMIADVPLGAFLSGGVDSSGIVATMAKIDSKPVTTCSIGFDSETFNETEFAKLVAKKYNTDHHELTVHENVTDNLKKIVSYFDEPFADPSLVPTFFVSELARQKVTVAIAGDGGDEVFAGYEKYSVDAIENRIRDICPKFIRKHIVPPMEHFFSLFHNRLFKKAVTLLNTLQQEPDMGFYLSNAQITDKEWNRIASAGVKKQLGGYHPSSITTGYYQQSDAKDHLGKILYTDMKSYLPGDILVKVDRMSMANSLEVRAPLLDYQLMEFAATIPSKFKFFKGEKKHILKEAFKADLPHDILYRKKMGFSVPLAEWLRKEVYQLAEKEILHSSHGLKDFFNMKEVEKLWQQHQSHEKDHATLIWSLLMFQMWWNEYMPDGYEST